jgi:hypothetical protein
MRPTESSRAPIPSRHVLRDRFGLTKPRSEMSGFTLPAAPAYEQAGTAIQARPSRFPSRHESLVTSGVVVRYW